LLVDTQPHRLRDIVVGDGQDRGRCFDHADAQRPGDELLDRYCGALGVNAQATAEQKFGMKPSEHHVGVGDRGRRAAAAVAGRPRIGANALRTDMEESAGIDARDAAAAGADGVDRYGRTAQWKASISR
jgi:hypothetical protein